MYIKDYMYVHVIKGEKKKEDINNTSKQRKKSRPDSKTVRKKDCKI